MEAASHRSMSTHDAFILKLFLFEVQLTYNVVLISAVKFTRQTESVLYMCIRIYIYIFFFSFIFISYYKQGEKTALRLGENNSK